MLSRAAKSLPIDVAGFDVLKQFMAHKIETKAVFDTVEQMLRKACEPPHDQSLHNARVEYGVELRLSTKQMVKAKNRKSLLHAIDPELHDRLLSESQTRYEDEVREYLLDQRDLALAIARTMVALTSSTRHAKTCIDNIAHHELSKQN